MLLDGVYLFPQCESRAQFFDSCRKTWLPTLAQPSIFLWRDTPADCAPHAPGFDCDGAQFCQVDERVTFEVLLASFPLEQPALHRPGTLIHFLDIGGTQPSEASRLEQVLWGLRNYLSDVDQY